MAPVTTPNVLLGADDVYLPGVVEDLQKFVGDATEWIRDGTRQALLDAQRIARLTIDQDLGNFTDRQLMRTQYASSLNTEVAKLTASYQSDILLATGPGSALAQQITTITARIDDPTNGPVANANATSSLTTRVTQAEGNITSISQQLSTVTTQVNDPTTGLQANADATTLLSARVDQVDGQLSSQADAITSLNTQVGDISASANFRMSVYAAPSGYSSRIGMEARGDLLGRTARQASSLMCRRAKLSRPELLLWRISSQSPTARIPGSHSYSRAGY